MANFDPSRLQNRLIDFDEIRTLELSPEDHQPCKISFRSDDVGGFGEYPVCHCRILRARVQPTLDPYAEAFIAGPLR